MPFFSIIVPTYNAANTVQRCLRSVLAQTNTDVEIIVQDGNSSDETEEVVCRIDDSRIRFFSERDNGVYDAMNKAIDHSTGMWLLFLGSDDYLYNSTVLTDMRKELNRSAAALVYGNVKIIGDTPWAKDGTIYNGEIDLPSLLSKHNYSHQAIFYHRRIFEDGHRYNLKYRICADYDFNLFCTAKYHVQYIPIVVSCFVSGGLSSVNDDEVFIQDTWTNIIRYFGSKLLKNSLSPFRKNMKQAAKVFFMRFDFYHALVAFSLYFYHSSRKPRFNGKTLL